MNPPRHSAKCRWTVLTLGMAFTLSGLEGCQRTPSPPPTPPRQLDRGRISYPFPELKINIDNYPMMDGSTSAQPLQMIVACKIFGLGSHWFHSEKDDTRRLWPMMI